MNKILLQKAFNSLMTSNFNFKFDCHINAGVGHIRGILIYDCEDAGKIKNALDNEILKKSKLTKTKTWYLGERKEIFYLKFRKEMEIEIPELEKFEVSNYA